MNWVTFRGELRTELQDTGETKRYTDDLLFVYVKMAIRDYSTWFPYQKNRVQLSLTSGTCTLPTDFLEEIYVECPLNTYLERRLIRPGSKYPATSNVFYYYIHGGTLYITGSPSDDAFLTYNAVHPIPDAKDDDDFVFTMPDADLELISLYMKAKVYEYIRSKQASLDRFKVTAGARDDNPVQPEYDDLMGSYYKKIAERYRGGSIALYRPGRIR